MTKIKLACALLLIINGAYFSYVWLWPTLKPEQNEQIAQTSQNSPKLILISEVEQANESEQATVKKNNVVVQNCVFVQNITSQRIRSELKERFNGLYLQTEDRLEKEATPGSYMVYVTPYSSLEESQREASVLRRSNVDGFVINDGEFKHAIRLGVFEKKSNAEKKQSEVAARGYSVKIKQQPIMKDRYTLIIKGNNLSALPKGYWGKIAKQFKQIDIVEKACI